MKLFGVCSKARPICIVTELMTNGKSFLYHDGLARDILHGIVNDLRDNLSEKLARCKIIFAYKLCNRH